MKNEKALKLLKIIIEDLTIKEIERYENGQKSLNCEEIYEDLERDLNQLKRLTRLKLHKPGVY